MKTLAALVVATCLLAPLVIGAEVDDPPTGQTLVEPVCKKKVTKPSNFRFEEFIGYQYTVAFLSDDPTLNDYHSAIETSYRSNSSWYFIFTINKWNGTQENFQYVISRWSENEIIETLLVNDVPFAKYKIVVYGYESQKYIQFLLCGNKGKNHLRFTLLYGDFVLKNDLKENLFANDKHQNFNTKLIPIGSKNPNKKNGDKHSVETKSAED